MAIALVVSIVLHLSAFGLAQSVRDWRGRAVTESRSTEDEDDAKADPPEENEFAPGIEDGAPALVTWIGYDEYEEHLAQLAQVDQAAFTAATTRGAPDSMNEQEAPANAKPQAVAEAEAEAEDAKPQAAEAAPVETAPTETDAPAEAAPAAEAVETEPEVTEQIVEADPSMRPSTVPTPMPGVAPNPVAPPRGEEVAEDAVQSDKDSPATSTKQAPQVDWNNGKPLAVEGMEVHPYSLLRHIMVDSHDTMFTSRLHGGRWTGAVKRNPIVSLRFDRRGRAGEVRIIRPSGYPPLDDLYLKSWMARWTASDKRLSQLGPDDLTSPIQIRIMFIDEPKAPDAGDGGGR